MDSLDSLAARAAAMLAEPGALVVLVATLLGFLVPLLLVCPPVAPRPSDVLRETHTRAGDGWRRVEDHDTGDTGDKPRLHSLWVYPIKSCPGLRVQRSRVLPTGLEFDRLFAFARRPVGGAPDGPGGASGGSPADPPDVWQTLTQRDVPRLAALQVELWRPDLAKARRVREASASSLSFRLGATYVVVRYPWRAPGWPGRAAWAAAKLARGWRAQPEVEIVLPVGDDDDQEDGDQPDDQAATARLRVWRDVVRARDLSARLPPSLPAFLGLPADRHQLGLLRVRPDHLRPIFRCAPRADEAGYQVVTGFQDAYPLHLLNRRSVRALEALVQTDAALPRLDERRFRANILVDGIDAYDEDAWKRVSFQPAPGSALDEAAFYVCCRTVRCKLPNVDPDSGVRHRREPDAALRAHRAIDAGAPRMGCLGMQLAPDFPPPRQPELMELTLEAGMAVVVRERGPHLYIKI